MFKPIVAFMLAFCLIGRISARGPNQSLPRQCLAQVRCTNIEDIRWATDGQRCFVLLNACHLRTANCARLRRKEPLLRPLARPKCQRLCPDVCTLQYEPVCAEHRGQRRQFGNSCQLGAHICRTGEFYQFLYRGDCQPQTTVETLTI